ncbi:putative WD repeat-containing protein C2A9.03 [Artemisia annua]|uniref:Putative WD repeat-containing protein C2A9.03 n=1 Tax=Artemisia annua TaxID=35608 RepID=A0A2U1KQP4_ARTAN|nr:putative WD repeat-containing protein C2A9.03 [Artemisia annua]
MRVMTANNDALIRVFEPIDDLQIMEHKKSIKTKPLAVLKGRMCAIRAIRFNSDGRYLAIAEPADFVHIFDSQTDYKSRVSLCRKGGSNDFDCTFGELHLYFSEFIVATLEITPFPCILEK